MNTSRMWLYMWLAVQGLADGRNRVNCDILTDDVAMDQVNDAEPERTFSSTVNTHPKTIRYSRDMMMKNRYKGKKIDTDIVIKLKELGIYKNRGRRGGKNTKRKIKTQITNRNERKHLSAERPRVLSTIKTNGKTELRHVPPKLLLTNPQSLTNVFEEFDTMITKNRPDIVAVCETWFSENKPARLYEVDNYVMFHKDRSTRGGGVALYVNETLQMYPLNITVPDNLECLWIMIDQCYSRWMKKLIICCLYHPPRAFTHNDLLQHLVSSVDFLRSKYSDAQVVIMGDCNDLDSEYICSELNLRCIVNEPTHENSILDLIMTDVELYVNCELLPPIGLSKHKCVMSTPHPPPSPPPYCTKTFRPFRESSIRSFGQWITAYEWREIMISDDAEEAVTKLDKVLKQQYKACFPEITQRLRKNNKPWITSRILRLMDDRRKAYDRGRMDEWRQLHFRTKQEIKRAKKETARKIERNEVNSKNFSKELKCVLGNKKKEVKIPFLSHMCDLDISKEICNHFTNICTVFPEVDCLELPCFLPVNDVITLDRCDVYKALSTLNINKASPPDLLPKRLFKEFAYEISVPLTYIFNLCLSNGLFPSLWKRATITALQKKPIVSNLGDLRPVSLTPDFGKILEGFVAKMILEDIKPNIDPYQYGNLKDSSTTHYLINLLDNVLKGIDKPKHIAQIVLIDFKKAFDYVDHSVAIRELYLLGCRPSLLPFVVNFLSGRQHRVRYRDSLSDWEDITCGVPQGTKLGPIIFLAIINSVSRNENIHLKFVDDLTLAEVVDTADVITFDMQNILNRLQNECLHVKMSTNPLKCEVMIVSPPKRPIAYPQLILNQCSLPIVNECKLLGVYINSSLNWNDHVTYLVNKVNRCMFILYRAKHFRFKRETMFTLYSWYIRTSLEYAAPVWHPGLTNEQHERLERIQKRCFRIILGESYVSYRNALDLLKTTTLYNRREELSLKFGLNLLKSDQHRHLLPPYLHDLHGRNTRRGRYLLQPVRCRTSRHQNSTIPYLVKLLNCHANM